MIEVGQGATLIRKEKFVLSLSSLLYYLPPPPKKNNELVVVDVESPNFQFQTHPSPPPKTLVNSFLIVLLDLSLPPCSFRFPCLQPILYLF